MQLILESCHQYENPDNMLGYGIPNFNEAYLRLQSELPAQKLNKPVISPNPFGEVAQLHYLADSDLYVILELYNMYGQQLRTYTLDLRIGYNRIELNNLPTQGRGMYFFNFRTNERRFVIPVLRL